MAKRHSHKHLTLDDRITILTELKKKTELKEIARKINKDPTTISKEVKLHRYLKEVNAPYNYSDCYFCVHLKECKLKTLCKTCISIRSTNSFCKNCGYVKGKNKLCSNYYEFECNKINRWPYVCHNCSMYSGCRVKKKHFYDPKLAQKEYEITLKESREGIDSTTANFKELDNLISNGVRDGKSIYSILLNHPEIDKSERTIYRYVGNRYLGIKDIDLRNKVKMKPRKQYKESHIDKKVIDNNRSYLDYVNFIAKNPSVHGAQLDLVIGKQEDNQLLMTLIFPFSNLMLIYLIPNKESSTIVNAFDKIEDAIGYENFTKIFPYILTDRGSEFSNASEIETSKINGKKRTNLFYCNPYSSSQKAQIERNHEFIRYYYPKGKSMNDLTIDRVNSMASHINSYPREAKNNNTPYNIAMILFGKDLLDLLNIYFINFDDIILNKSLFK